MELKLTSTLTISDHQRIRELRALLAAVRLSKAEAARDDAQEVHFYKAFVALADAVNDCLAQPVNWHGLPDAAVVQAAEKLLSFSETDAKKSDYTSEPVSVVVAHQR